MNDMLKSNKPCLIYFPSIGNSTLGFITIAESNHNVPFEIKRVYWTYFTPHNVTRGGHAHKNLHQIIFAVSGRIEFSIETLSGEKSHFLLESPDTGLYLPSLTWRDITFSHNAVLLCLASEHYNESDYIRYYSDFKNEFRSQEI
ncbi:sugar 3,4-ketoisomerase [Adhaeribacter pallidiroseus]|uniref:dTDP-4-dehydrorhamnose 3,5-epimerase n=1 Tax=Adhaeribacter pallidiroseus TaxID=2072847 RepID=A0A369QLM0_9BACT|nr:FdtA/QdtA family cupin domain-containing protein [Adhaeribacter pallidiroseus]RDC64126.1 dTDP-4-dehydrorhamnose 3,5-epimerase [Adhaeribacter pallidiroseus]